MLLDKHADMSGIGGGIKIVKKQKKLVSRMGKLNPYNIRNLSEVNPVPVQSVATEKNTDTPRRTFDLGHKLNKQKKKNKLKRRVNVLKKKVKAKKQKKQIKVAKKRKRERRLFAKDFDEGI